MHTNCSALETQANTCASSDAVVAYTAAIHAQSHPAWYSRLATEGVSALQCVKRGICATRPTLKASTCVLCDRLQNMTCVNRRGSFLSAMPQSATVFLRKQDGHLSKWSQAQGPAPSAMPHTLHVPCYTRDYVP